MYSRVKLFTDFDLSCVPHPLSNDLIPLQNEKAIERALKSLVEMVRFDSPFNPYLHVGISEYLFMIADMTTAIALQSRIEWAIQKYEPRVDIKELRVTPNEAENGFDVQLTYNINGLNKIHTTNFYFKRIR